VDILLLGRDLLWIYEGRNNGWWYYEQELQDVLETSYKQGQFTVDWIICGQSVTIDLIGMTQTNAKAVRDIRRIGKDEICKYLIKGVAGMQ
jgi:hypothetical protein